MLNGIAKSIIILNVVMLGFIMFRVLILYVSYLIVMLSAIMLRIVVQNVIRSSVILPSIVMLRVSFLIVMKSAIMLNVVILSDVLKCHVECLFVEFRYADCRYAGYCYDE
jgi:hypothetical protein